MSKDEVSLTNHVGTIYNEDTDTLGTSGSGQAFAALSHQSVDPRCANNITTKPVLGFSNLAPELRLQIWNTTLEMQTKEPRVVNIYVECHYAPPSRLTLLNHKELQKDMVGNLLNTNYEARGVAQGYLSWRPTEWNPDALPSQDEWRGLRQLAAELQKRRIDPAKDILFLNGLDFEHGTPYDHYLSDRLTGLGLTDPKGGKHTLTLEEPERAITNKFHTIILPVYGLVETWGSTATFEDPFTPTAADKPGIPLANRTIIALVGHYRGRNLQLADLAFIPDAEIAQIARCGDGPRLLPGDTRDGTSEKAKAASVLQRDVLVMLAVWEEWADQARAREAREPREGESGYDDVLPGLELAGEWPRPRLRFARVREEVLGRLTGEDLYMGVP